MTEELAEVIIENIKRYEFYRSNRETQHPFRCLC